MESNKKHLFLSVYNLRRLGRIYDSLLKCGMPEILVPYYMHPVVYSGYSMGEVIKIYCRDVEIETIDETSYYRGSKWTAKHGLTVLRFTKKSLKEYLTACRDYCCAERAERAERSQKKVKLKEIVMANLDRNSSKLNPREKNISAEIKGEYCTVFNL